VSVASDAEDGFVESEFDEFAGFVLAEFAPEEFGKPVDDESFDDPGGVVPVSSATAIPGTVATAAPTPSATANAPTCPTYFAYPILIPLANLDVHFIYAYVSEE
jgi:hypothetical protein